MTPESQLLYAAYSGGERRVRELLAQGVEVDVRDGKGRTPLMLAAGNINERIVGILLEAGADPTVCNKGNRPLIDYVNHIGIARMILRAIPSEQREWAATRLLFRSTRNSELLQCALDAGAKVNARNKRADTPLIWHLYNVQGNVECIRLLLEAGANPRAGNSHGDTPILMAVWQNDLEVIKLLIKAGCDVNEGNYFWGTPLHKMVAYRNVLMAKLLIDAGADVNRTDAKGWTPLMQARQDDAEMVQLLIEAGANVNAKNVNGSVLTYFHKMSDEVARLLYDAGACYDVTLESDLVHAIENPHTIWLKDLIRAGLDVNCRVGDDCTLLHIAAWGGCKDAMKLLLAAGAEAFINHRDSDEGLTALHAAVVACRDNDTFCPENVTMLLAAGAEVNLADITGWTPLHSCARYNLPELVPILLAAGADPKMKEKTWGDTPLKLAKRYGNKEVYAVLKKGSK